MKDTIQGEKVELPLSVDNFKGLSRETAHLMIVAMVDGVTVVGLDGKILDCNDAVLRLHDVSRDEYVGKSVYDFVAPEDRQRAVKGASEVLEKGCLRSEVKALRKEGGTFDAEINVSLLKDASGEPSAFLGVTRDITEWNRKKEAVKESEQKFRSIFESANDCMVYLDSFGTILDANGKAVGLFGGSREELLGKHFTKVGVLSPRDMPKLLSAFANGLVGKHPTLNISITNKKGREIWLECLGSLTRTRDKPALLVIARDVTERKRMEEVLRESEEKYRSMVELSPDSIVTFDVKGVITSCNPTATKMTGYSKDEIVGKHFSRLGFLRASDIPKYLKLFSLAVLRGEVPKSLEVNCVRNDGTPYLAEVRFSLLREGGKTVGFQVIGTDITERKKSEEALRKSENKSRTLLENLPQKIFFKDKNSVYISCNENYARDLRIKSNEITSKTDYDFYPKKLAEKYRADDKRIMESGKTEDLEEEYIQDERKVFVHTVKTPVKDENGNVVGILGTFWDITEHKKTEEALRESEEKYRNLFQNARDVIITFDLKGNLTSVNRVATAYGFREDEIVGKNMLKFVSKKYWPRILMELAQVGRGKPTEGEVEIITPKGKKIAEYRANPIKRENKIIGVQSTLRDITERKQTEEALRESEEKYRNLFQNARDVIATFDLKGNVTSVNKAVEEYDFKRDEFLGKNMLKFVSRKYWPKLLRELASVIRGKPVEGELEIITPRGKKIADYRSNPIVKNNKVIGFETIMRDITERKEMEEELRQYSEHLEELVQKRTAELSESEKRYSVLVEEATDGVVIWQDGKINFANKRAAEIFGYSRDELIGMPLEKPVDEKYRHLVMDRYTRRLRGEKVPATYEIEVITKNSEHKPIELSATCINYQGRPADLIIIRDISERKRMEEQRLRLERLATMGELAAMVAHDLRNPLTSIRNASYYIKNTCPYKGNAECKTAAEMFDIIEQETLSANNIINDLLDFSAERPLQKTSQNINEIVDVSIAKSNVPKNISIETHFAKDATATVDEKQLERVFLNLIKNAAQAMPDGGKLAVTTEETKANVEIMFADTGIGISEENISKLFTPLFTTRAKGIGMGLAICKKIVEEHHGTIDVKSKVGEGTTFTIKLPKEERGDDQ